MSPKSVAFTFGSSTTNRVYSTVDKDGTGVVIRRDSDSNGKAQFWMCSLDAGQPGSWNLINFTFPEGTTNETLDLDQPFYLGYTGDPSNPTIYVYEENDDDDFYSVQYSDLYNYQLIRFSDDSDFELCTSFFAKDNLIAVCDTEYNYYIGESQKTLIPFTNPDELVNRIVGDLSITGGTHASPVGLLQPLPGHSDPVRIRWWFQGNETYFENPRVTPEAIVCFDDYIVWHSNGSDNNTPSVGWIDISKTGNPVTNFNSVVAKGKTVAITKSGTQFQQGDIWYATSDGTVYYVDRSRNDSHQVLDARVDISGGSSTISQLWADSCFLYVLTDNGLGGAWKISDVQ